MPVLLIGLDDTDMPGTRGTNQLAREIVRRAGTVGWRCEWIVRHQLLDDPRVPCTSKNGSASIRLAVEKLDLPSVVDLCRTTMREWFITGSDPGLCVASAEQVPDEVVRFGRRCQSELVDMEQPRELARQHGLHLEGLGGTEGGVIGALAAVGLAKEGRSGRIVQWQTWPDDLSGWESVEVLARRDVTVRNSDTGKAVRSGMVDVGKHLRPNLREHGAVLLVQPRSDVVDEYLALKRL